MHVQEERLLDIVHELAMGKMGAEGHQKASPQAEGMEEDSKPQPVVVPALLSQAFC